MNAASDKINIGFVLDHDQALEIFQAAGHTYPSIPEGLNTVCRFFITEDGLPALIVNQRGFAPIQSDNEEPVNGCSMAIALDAPSIESGRATLFAWFKQEIPPRADTEIVPLPDER